MKNALHILQYAKKAPLRLNSEKIKTVALAIIGLHLSEGIRKFVSQTVIRKFIYNIIFLEALLLILVLLKPIVIWEN